MTMQEYEDLLNQHDWYFQNTDDHKVWERGKASEDHLKELAKTNPAFKILYNIKLRGYYPQAMPLK